MKLTNTSNGGSVVVSDEYAERLIKSGHWKSDEEKPKAPAAKRGRATAKAEEEK